MLAGDVAVAERQHGWLEMKQTSWVATGVAQPLEGEDYTERSYR